jgi:ribosomal protein S27E
MAMKTGIGYVAAVEVQCPHCGEFVTAENGSFLFCEHRNVGQAGQVVECDSCGKSLRLPALLGKTRR